MDVQIPILPVESVVFDPSTLVPKRRFQILRVLVLVGVGVSMSYPSTIFLVAVVADLPA